MRHTIFTSMAKKLGYCDKSFRKQMLATITTKGLKRYTREIVALINIAITRRRNLTAVDAEGFALALTISPIFIRKIFKQLQIDKIYLEQYLSNYAVDHVVLFN